MTPWNLNNKRAVITGSTKGIGKAIAEEFLQLGAEVFICSRTQKDVDAFVKQWSDKGYKAFGMAADLSSPNGRSKFIDAVKSRWEKFDILVNNVGTNIRKKFLDFSEEEYRQILETNMFSAMQISKGFFDPLKASGNTSIINITSIAGLYDLGTGTPYGMSKAAEIQMTKHLAAEWASFGIRVNSIAPWFIRTPLTEGLLAKPEWYDKIITRTPLGRVGHVDEISSLAAFLAMDKSSYITGQNITVDGGTSARIF